MTRFQPVLMKLGRNDPCHCGSGKKYKNCHLGAEPALVASNDERAGYDEIRRILVDDFGFTNLETYGRWIREVRPGLTPTPELVRRLSPDRIDCRAFWRACDELFGVDPVHNVMIAPEIGELPYPITTREDANRMNLRLAKSFAITSEHVYSAVDVCPRFEGVVQATAAGFLPDGFADSAAHSFSYVVSSNVFQHLSARQRSRWFRDAQRLLHREGLFIFNLLVDTAKISARARDRDGNAWCDHYGQFTEIPKLGQLHDELSGLFRIIYVTQRYDGVMNFVCQKTSP